MDCDWAYDNAREEDAMQEELDKKKALYIAGYVKCDELAGGKDKDAAIVEATECWHACYCNLTGKLYASKADKEAAWEAMRKERGIS